MTYRAPRTFLLIAAGLLPALVLAHTGLDAGAHHEAGFVQGLLHPLTGVDHLAAMLAVGLWSALALRRLWVAPVAFVFMLSVGALAGVAGVSLPAVEPMIAASLLVMGLLVATRTQAPAVVAAGLVGVFAIFHGVAHGAELSGGAGAWPALAGMVLTTAALHVAGLAGGLVMRSHNPWWGRVTGAAITALGGWLLLQVAA